MKALLAVIVSWMSMPALAAEFHLQSWAARNEQWNAGNQVIAGDFNDDGRDDVAIISASGYCHSNVSVYASSGSSFVFSVWGVGLLSGCGSGARWLSGDFNGNGKSDLAVVVNDSGQNTVRVFDYGYQLNVPMSVCKYRCHGMIRGRKIGLRAARYHECRIVYRNIQLVSVMSPPDTTSPQIIGLMHTGLVPGTSNINGEVGILMRTENLILLRFGRTMVRLA